MLRALDAIPPAGGAAVMGTGIVSIGLGLDHQPTLSRMLCAIAIALWLVVLASFVRRGLQYPHRLRREARLPDALAVVAGTTVVGARVALAGQAWAGDALLALGLCLWFGLLSPVLRHWRTPTVGVSFMPAVATESLAVLAALLAIEAHVGWLAAGALLPLLAGLVAYAYAVVRVDIRQLVAGRGDQWIFGGALAIAALACAQVTVALQRTGTLDGGRRALDDAGLVLWSAAALWLPGLVAGELISPRLRYDTRRWSTVFPLGMYAVATTAAGTVNGIGGLRDVGHILVWPAFAFWGITFAGLLAHGGGVLSAAVSEERHPAPASRKT